MSDRRACWNRDATLIGGTWRHTAVTSTVTDPATETVIGHAASADPGDVDDTVAAAAQAGASWAATPAEQRALLLDALVTQLHARRELLVETTVAEVGAPVTVAEQAHIDLGIEIIASYARLAREVPEHERVGNSLVLRRPAGVVGCITPWNYPFYQLAGKVGAVLASGCTAVIKPAELTPLSTYLFADAALEAGLPHGVLNLVPGNGRTVGAALAEHRGIDVVSFTGSTAVGRAVAHAAADSFTRTCLELGGKSASIVFDDSDLATAVTATVESAMLNSGQTCSAWTRLLGPRNQYNEAVELAAKAADRFVVADPRSRDTDLGPVISTAHRSRVAEMIDGAHERGGRIVAGGSARPKQLPTGHFLAPTVIADLAPDDPAVQQELFGPVLVVLPHDGDAHAIRLANDNNYGLAGAVWSDDEQRALQAAAQIDTGQVDINGAAFNPEAPFGGWKASGIGRELGRAGLDELIETTAIQR